MGTRFTAACALVACTALAPACRTGDAERPAFRPGRVTYDTAPIDVTRFVEDPAVRGKILSMSFGEAAARLGSLAFDAMAEIELSRGGDSYEQVDRWSIRQDPSGNFHVRSLTPVGKVEFYLVGDDVFVRQDDGQLRRKPRREVETETWTETAHASLQQSLQLFEPRLGFRDPRSVDLGGRAAFRFTLGLAPRGDQTALAALPAGQSRLPVAPPARWRELAEPLAVSGHLWVDAETGVALKLELDGRLEVPDREVRPTEITVSYRGGVLVNEIGKVKKIEVPASIPEYRRRVPPRDLLGFWKEQQPAAPPEH